MYILHVALGGCLTYPVIPYGLTEDTGGHIAYVLGAALAQARRADVDRVDIVTRAFNDRSLGDDHARLTQNISSKMEILRLATRNTRYASKDALIAERPALRRAFHALLAGLARKPDVIHVHFADAADVVRVTARTLRIPVVYTPHSLGIDKLRNGSCEGSAPLSRRIEEERTALIRSHAIIVSSRDEAERQIDGYGVDVGAQIHRIAPGVTQRAQDRRTDAARKLVDPLLTVVGRPMILAIARPVEKKNLAGLARAYLRHPTLADLADLVILPGQCGEDVVQTPEGRDVISELRDLAQSSPGRIAIPDRHSPEEVSQLYRLAVERRGVFVNPAFHEPFGLTLLEAAQAGLPVVATREGGPIDILQALRHGTLVDPRNRQEIGGAIHGLLTDAERWQAAHGNGLRNIAQFDWDRWADQTQQVYRSLRAAPVRYRDPGWLLASDIDGTLTGCADGARRFRAWADGRHNPFVVATGRSITEARAVLSAWSLPEPDAFITAVGTEIYRRTGRGRLTLCADFARALSCAWNRLAVLAVLRSMDVVMQPRIEQRRWKLGCRGTEEVAQAVRAELSRAGLSARVIVSHGDLLDVLAPNGGKAAAIEAVAKAWGLTLADCIAAGDSGNDRDMLLGCGSAILVANARAELDDLQDRPGLHRSALPHAHGVLDGLRRFASVGAVKTPGVLA